MMVPVPMPPISLLSVAIGPVSVVQEPDTVSAEIAEPPVAAVTVTLACAAAARFTLANVKQTAHSKARMALFGLVISVETEVLCGRRPAQGGSPGGSRVDSRRAVRQSRDCAKWLVAHKHSPPFIAFSAPETNSSEYGMPFGRNTGFRRVSLG
jgi:hypothetical protein